MKISYLVMSILCVCMSSCLLQSKIGREGAIDKAEAFVVEHGFAHKRIDLDSTNIQLDINEYFLTKNQTIDFRHNSLVPKAIYVRKYGLGKWLVGFETTGGNSGYYAQDTTRKRVTAVIVSRNGKRVHMEHQDYLAEKNALIR